MDGLHVGKFNADVQKYLQYPDMVLGEVEADERTQRG
jgi:hypothetical protein